MQLTEHFKTEEFRCKCRECDRNGDDVSRRLVYFLQMLRYKWQSRLDVTSGIRCVNHNKVVHGHPSSLHLFGGATDVAPLEPAYLNTLYHCAEQVGFGGLGYYPDNGFIHVDVGGEGRRWVRHGGNYIYWMESD